MALAPAANANPTGAQVAAGHATFQAAGNRLTVTNAPGTILNWQSFSIGAGEVTRFQQQSAMSAVLNRVTGADPSSILGSLTSNGRVFLINPYGVVFGQGAVIDTAGFVASTLNIRDEDFLAGRLRFEGGGNGVLRNEGSIRASGDIFLVGPQIQNAGLIRSEGGSVLLAAGRSVMITSPDAQGVQFALQAPADAALNIGTIEAKNAAGLFAGTLRHSGDIRAVSASADASGRVILSAQKNAILDGNATVSVDNSAGRGGSVLITGEHVGLFDNVTVSARGTAGGGEILIGGDYQGKNPDVRNAWRTYVGPDVALSADSVRDGDGGKIIVWSDDVTRYFGHASVRGGSHGGNGGLVEVSGKGDLVYAGTVDLAGPSGRAGALLLDPTNIIVQAGTGTLDPALTAPGDALLAFGEGTGSSLDVARLTVFTTGTVEIQATNDITFNTSVTMQSGVTLKAAALNNVNVNAGITTSGGGTLILEADTDLSGAGAVNFAAVTINAPLTVNGKASVAGTVFAGDAAINGLLSLPSGTAMTIDTGKTLTANGGMTATTAAFASSGIQGGGTLVIPSGELFQFNSNDSRSLFLDNVTVNNAGTFRLNGITSNNSVMLNNGAVFNNQAGGQIVFSQPGNFIGTDSGAGTLNNGGSIASTGNNNATLSMTTLVLNGGTVLNTGSGSVLRSGANSTYSGSLTLDSALRLTGGTHAFADGAVLNGSGSVVQDGAASVTMNNVTANVLYDLTPSDTLTLGAGKTFVAAGGMTAATAAFASSGIQGGGTLVIPSGTLFQFNSNDSRSLFLDNVTVNNAGTFRLNGITSNNSVMLNNGAVFNNQADGQIVFSQPGNFIGTDSGAGTLNNGGSIVSTGNNNVTLSMTTLAANTGSVLDAGSGGVFRNAGSTTFAGNLTLNSALNLTGGSHVFADGTVLNGGGGVVQDGATSVTMNNVTANVPYSLTPSDTLTLGAGKTFVAAGGMTAATAAFASSGIQGGGTLVIPSGALFQFNSNDSRSLFLDNVTVNNAGTFRLNGITSNNSVMLNNGAVFNNQAGGQIVFSQPGNFIGTDSGAGTLNNSGTIAAGGGNISISATTVTNSGTLDVTAGDATISQGLVSMAGLINVGTGRTLNIGGAGLDWQGGTLQGAGTYSLASLAITGGGARTLDGPTIGVSSLSLSGGSLAVQGGALNLSGTTTIAAGATLTRSGGLLNVGGPLDNNGTFGVDTGVFDLANGGTSSGTFDAGSGATINFSGGTHSLADGAVLMGGGSFGYTGGTLDIAGSAAGVTLAAGSTLSVSARTVGGSGKLVNLGALNLADGIVVGSVENHGALNASGASAINGAALDLVAGVLDLAPGGTLTKSGGSVNWIGGSIAGTGALSGNLSFAGSGTRILSGPTLNLGAATLPGGTLTLQAGALNFGGIATIGSGALLDVAGGSVTGASSIDVQGAVKMSGGSLTATSLGLVPGGTLSGLGTVNASVVNGGAVSPGGSPGTLIINGNYAQTPTGVLNIELGGTTQGVTYDLLQVNGTASLAGTLNVSLFGGFTGTASDLFDVITYAGRTGDFSTTSFPAGAVMTATPNAAFYQLALVTPPSSPPPVGGGAIADAVAALPGNDVRVLQDRFFAAVEQEKEPGDEAKKGAVPECR